MEILIQNAYTIVVPSRAERKYATVVKQLNSEQL